jgi:hypothetical protein
MSIKTVRSVVALIGAALLTLVALPAQAFTPTVSEVRYPPGVDPGDSWYGAAITSDATTFVVTDSANPAGLWVIDVAANSATSVTGTPRASEVIIDDAGAYAYSFGSHTTENVYKIDLSTNAVVATWTDPALTLQSDSQMFFSADGSSLYMVGLVGNYPYATGVAKVNLASGAITQYVASGSSGDIATGGAAYDTASGHIFIQYKDIATGLTSGFYDFNTTANTFTDVPWSGSGVLSACDLKSGVWVCLVDDTNPYITKIDSTGSATGAPLAVDAAVTSVESVTLTPDGSQAYVFGTNTAPGANNRGSAQVVDTTTMSSVTVLNFDFDYSHKVVLAPDAGQIWFTSDYFGDYDGGYQVVQFTDPNAGSGEELAPTGGNSAMAGTLVALSALALAAGLFTRVASRRHRARS